MEIGILFYLVGLCEAISIVIKPRSCNRIPNATNKVRQSYRYYYQPKYLVNVASKVEIVHFFFLTCVLQNRL